MRNIIISSLALLILVSLPCRGNAFTYWDFFKQKNRYQGPVMRIGGGVAFLADEELASNYTMGQSVFFDYNILRFRFGFIGLDCYSRLMTKFFMATKDSIDESETAVSEHYLLISGIDPGIRLKTYSYLFGKSFSFYISAAPRFVYCRTMYRNSGDSYGVDKNFFSIGVVGGTGFEISLYGNMGLFLEYNYGYTPVSETEANTEGHTVYAGVTFLTGVQ